MAVLDEVPGIEVSVQISGEDATEYDADDEASQDFAQQNSCPTMIKYIECIEDAEFAIKLVVGPEHNWCERTHILSFKLHIDGERIKARLLRKQGKLILNYKDVYDQQNQQWKEAKFKFESLKTSMYS
jgi:hypothetical protein